MIEKIMGFRFSSNTQAGAGFSLLPSVVAKIPCLLFSSIALAGAGFS